MKYEELTYRRMLQVIRSNRTARLAVVLDGAPYVVPVCFSCRMDGCIPVFEVRAGSNGDLLSALTAGSAVMLEFEAAAHGGAMETVLVRGRAMVEQSLAADRAGGKERCACGQRQSAGRYDAWGQSGRVRFDAHADYAADRYDPVDGAACSCSRTRENGASCPLHGGAGCSACARRESCGCAGNASRYGDAHDMSHNDQDDRFWGETHTAGCAAVITITAVEMTGRCYSACVTHCRSENDWEE